jgi:putative hydrolase of the HAD superfamily
VTEAEPPAPYRALIVDFGGVLTTSVTTSFAAFCVEAGVDPGQLKGLLAAAYGPPGTEPADAGGLVHALETGKLGPEEFERTLAVRLSEGLEVPLAPSGLIGRLFGTMRPDDRMIEAVRAARRHGLKTGLISNTWGLDESRSGALDIFDARVLSGEVGLRKPQPEIYRVAAGRLDVEPEECVFVDDLPANVEGARAVGMAAVLHRDAAITVPKLEELLGVGLSG